MSAIAGDAPMGVEVYSAAETAGTDETEGSSVTRTRCSVSMAARPCVSMPMLGSVIAKEYRLTLFFLDNKYDFHSNIDYCRI